MEKLAYVIALGLVISILFIVLKVNQEVIEPDQNVRCVVVARYVSVAVACWEI